MIPTSKFRRISIFSRKRWQEGLSFCSRLGVAIVVISILPYQKLRRPIQSLPLFEWIETSIWIWPNSGMYMESLALLF